MPYLYNTFQWAHNLGWIIVALNLKTSDFKSLSIDPQLLPEGSQSSNFITIKETFYIENIGKGFKEYILKDVYQDWLESKKVKPKETKLERRMRYSLLMKENGWTRAELSRQLGVSRAWVTMTLG